MFLYIHYSKGIKSVLEAGLGKKAKSLRSAYDSLEEGGHMRIDDKVENQRRSPFRAPLREVLRESRIRVARILQEWNETQRSELHTQIKEAGREARRRVQDVLGYNPIEGPPKYLP